MAPNPENWSALVARVQQLEKELKSWPPENIQAIKAPTLGIIGDLYIILPEHAVGMLRLLGGGVAGDLAGLPHSRLAVFPGTTHDARGSCRLTVPMIKEFLDAPTPDA